MKAPESSTDSQRMDEKPFAWGGLAGTCNMALVLALPTNGPYSIQASLEAAEE